MDIYGYPRVINQREKSQAGTCTDMRLEMGVDIYPRIGGWRTISCSRPALPCPALLTFLVRIF